MEYIPAKTILSGYREQREWFGCHYNMNLYRGCCHGCIYCDSRSECYGIQEFDRVRAKKDALYLLERELRAFSLGDDPFRTDIPKVVRSSIVNCSIRGG